MKAERKRRKERGNPRAMWRPARRPMGAAGWLRTLGLAALIAALAWAGTNLAPGIGAQTPPAPVGISRVMTSNPGACYSVGGRYYDWIELTNASDGTVDLSGWRLSDSIDQREAFSFADGTLLPGHGSLIVYCAPRPEDYEGSQIFCGFRLDADGELLLLSDPRQRVAQALSVPAMAASEIYQRDSLGGYEVIPFSRMVESGAVDLRPDYDPNGVVISEVMAANRTVLADGDGAFSDWIELCNRSAAPADLTGCALSDDDANQRKWALPARTLQPGEYLLVFASGKDRREGGELHANFKLSASGERVRLYGPDGTVLSWVEYEAMAPETSLSRLEDGGMTAELKPTPGFENTEAGARAALSLAMENPLELYINEVMCMGDGDDWIELYNGGGKSVDLSGMGLSDGTDHPRRWQFPQGAILPADSYMTVTLTGREGESGIQNGRFCANFALSAGETAALCRPDGTLIDRVVLFEQHRGVSYGRAEGQPRCRYFTESTPGQKNAAVSYEKKAAEVAFSEPGGPCAESALSVELSSDADVTIYYTADGSDPTTSSTVYTGPLRVKRGTVIKAVAWRRDVIPSDLAVRTFLPGASHTVRVVSVSGDRSRLNARSGMLNTGIKGVGSEAYVEVYEPDGERVIGQKCLMKLAGHSSREHEAQKGFSLRARKEYGESRFAYPLFSNRDYTGYKSFVMRASGQDCRQTFMRDSILSALAADTGVLYRETEVSVLYVNGEYWGVYNMRERVCDDMIAQFEGWENPEDIEISESSGTKATAGYNEMLRWVRHNDLSRDENVEKLRETVDIENYLDYVALEMFANNQDLNNFSCYRNLKADGRWRWALYDLDLSFQISGDNVTEWLSGDTVGSITTQSNVLFKNLMKNAAMRDQFLTRMGQLLATTFSSGSVEERIRRRYELLKPEMLAECRRWNWTTATWNRYGKAMLRYAESRPRNLIGYLCDDFKLTEAQRQTYFGEALAKIG